MDQPMVGRDKSSETKGDADDWFSGADRTGGDGAAAREPTWLEDEVQPEGPEPTANSPFARRRFVVLAGASLVLVVAVVVALVAFAGGGARTPTVLTTSTRAITTAPAATVPTTPAPSTPAVTLPAGVLKRGSTGADVKTVQRALARAGHSLGPFDGDYGPKTEQAVSAFQRSAGISVDGTYGPQTKKALEQELKSR